MIHQKEKILVVDDEVKIVEVVESYLENGGYSVYEAYNGKNAMDKFEEVNPSLVGEDCSAQLAFLNNTLVP